MATKKKRSNSGRMNQAAIDKLKQKVIANAVSIGEQADTRCLSCEEVFGTFDSLVAMWHGEDKVIELWQKCPHCGNELHCYFTDEATEKLRERFRDQHVRLAVAKSKMTEGHFALNETMREKYKRKDPQAYVREHLAAQAQEEDMLAVRQYAEKNNVDPTELLTQAQQLGIGAGKFLEIIKTNNSAAELTGRSEPVTEVAVVFEELNAGNDMVLYMESEASFTVSATATDETQVYYTDPLKTLPVGLELNKETGEVSGVPLAPGAFPVQILGRSGEGKTGVLKSRFVVKPAKPAEGVADG